MEAIAEQMRKDAFARHLRIELVEVGAGTAKVSMKVGPEHRNSAGMVLRRAPGAYGQTRLGGPART